MAERLYHVRQKLKELEATEKELTQVITTRIQQRGLKAVVSPRVRVLYRLRYPESCPGPTQDGPTARVA